MSYDEATSEGFGRLFDYISGDNEASEFRDVHNNFFYFKELQGVRLSIFHVFDRNV